MVHLHLTLGGTLSPTADKKYHAYTSRDESRPNSRVRDLVDTVLMIRLDCLIVATGK
jgi:hypothetical protein